MNPIDRAEAIALINAPEEELFPILARSDAARRAAFGRKVKLCSIVNVKSGACSEDCAFCAQSAAHPEAEAVVYPTLSPEEIEKARRRSAESGASRFSVVASGKGATEADIGRLAGVAESSQAPPKWCASLGLLSEKRLRALFEAGYDRYHHNLETSERFFPEICTTHTWLERLETVRRAKRVGMHVCSGGVFGLGETREDRVDLAFALLDEGVDSIPLNFLVAVPGTPLAERAPLAPSEILKTLAVFRLVNPVSELRIAGGRSLLGSLQPLLFAAGCDGMMIGDLLTVQGEDVRRDLQMLSDLGLARE